MLVQFSATISWLTSSQQSVTSWNYVLGAAGFDPFSANPVAVTNDTLLLTGLTAASTYDIFTIRLWYKLTGSGR